MKNKFYITVPIYYVNWDLHIGHFYSTLIADSIARYNRISWKNTRFTTWVDENSQKALLVAEEKNIPIMEYLDEMAWKHKKTWDDLNINYTDFIRTTEERHHKLVREVLQKTFDKWDIYQWEYKWMYCIGCEGFKKENDLVYLDTKTNKTFPIDPKKNIVSDTILKVCPDHLTIPDNVSEKNYFFKLSKYEDKLLKFYEENPNFITPADRFNEVKAFVKRWLEDFSISREKNTFWIKLPFDESQVAYVWYDALFNYITSEPKMWPADLHVVWKDIIKFHGIYWPAMLMAAWYEMPAQILTTWFFTIDGHKISKSIWNVINPVEFSKKYSKELLSLYLLSSFNIGQDWDFDQKQALLMYNAKLANNFWNLVNRVVVLALKIWWKLKNINVGADMISTQNILKNIKKYDLKQALDDSFKELDKLNKYVDETEPWKLVKEDEKEAGKVLYILAEWLRQVWLCLYVFFPEKIWEMFNKLWLENYINILEKWWLEELRNKKEIFNIKEKWEPLFKRFEV